MHQAVYEHMRSADLKGSDVRLLPFEVYNARAWPRRSLCTSMWAWKTLQQYSYKIPAHINVLELRSVFNYLRYRAQRVDLLPARIFIFLDSQVALSVLAKGRSSSLQLNNLLRRIAGLALLCDFRLYLGWCSTDANPADVPSRNG